MSGNSMYYCDEEMSERVYDWIKALEKENKELQAELAQLKYLEHLVTHTNKRVIPGEKDSIDALVDYVKKLEEKCDDYKGRIDEAIKYCEPHLKVMWSASVISRLLKCDFRDGFFELEKWKVS